MTTRNILMACKAHIDDLITDYTVKYFRWTDADASSEGPFIMLRLPGSGGQNDALKQEIDVLVALVTQPQLTLQGHDDMALIQRRFRESGAEGVVKRFEVLAPAQGPSYLENGRPVWVLNIRCYTESF